MARILAISSQVVSGHVGLSAIVPTLNFLGHEVLALPTVILSNHPGHEHCSGTQIDPIALNKMLDTLEANNLFSELDRVLTGYLPTADHVQFTCNAIRRVKAARPSAIIICDPVLGDDPTGLYIPQNAASAICNKLLPMSDITLPNRFELAWLSDMPVNTVPDALKAARTLKPRTTLATSIPVEPVATAETSTATNLANVLITSDTSRACISQHQSGVPHGTGDLLSALFVAETNLNSPSLGGIAARLNHVIAYSLGKPELALIEAAQSWQALKPHPEIEAA